jgi:dihydropteroate synthase
MDSFKNSTKRAIATWNCRGRLVVVDKPMVMGIQNITPDSFYAGSRVGNNEVVERAGAMIEAGADILDIGGQSTRPDSTYLDAQTEAERVLPVIAALRAAFPEILLSIDTFHHAVARDAVNSGADLVNDISGGSMDPMMIPTVAKLQVPYVLMHMKGTPQTMKQAAVYEDVVAEVLDYFIQHIEQCRQSGIKDVIADPGFGFAKNSTHNLMLLKSLEAFQILGVPLLVGLSRKSTIYSLLQTDAAHALNGTTVMNTIALMQGAAILRVHDVKEAREAVILTEAIKNSY